MAAAESCTIESAMLAGADAAEDDHDEVMSLTAGAAGAAGAPYAAPYWRLAGARWRR